MTDIVTVAPILLAAASFALSIYTLWVTQLRRGQLKMTRPTLVCLKRDSPNERDLLGEPKIFLRTLLFTTAKGRVIESMFLRVHQPSGMHVLDFWGHTEGGKLTLGSGLFVGPTGVSADHHFNPHRRGSDFTFGDGAYRVEVFASTVGQRRAQKLMEVVFAVDAAQADALTNLWFSPQKGIVQGFTCI